MAITVNLDVIMAKKKISAGQLAELIDITPANLSILKNNKAKAIRFSTLEAICKALDCQPGDILEYTAEDE
ncbi:MAG: helix-turn-helix transcriptional regulator [Firmicutes bacterium]|nr:helix-turn-helix transcriptional regulator [Bacillota bacterium]MBQ2270411.1 helix-turn-helix transcriptional regulator [Bacillota bacterium]MBR5001493.1 helix-turn-helix transcriptional regulator [Bacillota bacterium]MBR6499882.1 helix-turn-helix transcriptional regulator [Bacillota bacterium]